MNVILIGLGLGRSWSLWMELGTENFYWFWDWLRDATKRTGTGISPDMAPAIATDISPVEGSCVYP